MCGRSRPTASPGALLGADCGPDDGRRTAALVGWVLERAALQGHTALDAEAVRAALAERAVSDPDAAVREAVEEGVALLFQEGEDEEPEEDEAAEEGGLAPDADTPREPVGSFWASTATPWPRRVSPTVWPGWSTPARRPPTGRRPLPPPRARRRPS